MSQVSVVHTSLSLQFGGVPATHPLAGSHVSTPLQTLLSLQVTAGPAQTPAVQVSPVPPRPVPVHMLPSLHAAPSGSGMFEHALLAQLSVVHGLLSSQLNGPPATHVPVVGVFGVLQLDVAVHWSAVGHTTPP